MNRSRPRQPWQPILPWRPHLVAGQWNGTVSPSAINVSPSPTVALENASRQFTGGSVHRLPDGRRLVSEFGQPRDRGPIPRSIRSESRINILALRDQRHHDALA